MNNRINGTKDRLAAGELALGFGLRQSRTVDIATIAGTCGYDWLFIDMEHSSLDLDAACQIAMASIATGVTPIVRVPGHEHHHAARVLDNGALGIVFPHVDTPEAARRAVGICRYPPLGHRSMAGNQPMLRFEAHPSAAAARKANEETLVIVMIETPQAVDNAEAIAAVEGVDVLLIGTNDLCAEMGIHGQFDHPRVPEAYGKVIAACRKHGKFPGMGGVYEPKLMEAYVALGMRFVLGGSDLAFMMAGASARAAQLRGFLK